MRLCQSFQYRFILVPSSNGKTFCRNTPKNKTIRYFFLTRYIFKLDLQDTHKLQTWNEALGTILSKNDHVCMRHFAKHFIREFVNNGKIRRTLTADAIPYQNLGTSSKSPSPPVVPVRPLKCYLKSRSVFSCL